MTEDGLNPTFDPDTESVINDLGEVADNYLAALNVEQRIIILGIAHDVESNCRATLKARPQEGPRRTAATVLMDVITSLDSWMPDKMSAPLGVALTMAARELYLVTEEATTL